ncbi:Zinc finger, RING-type [Dillenia turbinata]|uniref:Zinc finger, RING-type n=1 Tax=Dillenia turbinata TaxID=194707 RepID=A0AAN8W2Z0_9MAGN
MLLAVFLVLFLPCAGLSVVFLIYMCLLWYSALSNYEFQIPVKPKAEKGLSASQLKKVPKVTGKELVLGTECAVCLDDIENDQPARLFPGCNHGFHVECADAWLSKHAVCPICRSKLGPLLENPDDNPC